MIYIIRGAPGSGKTSLARQILAANPQGHAIFEADDYFRTSDGYKFDASKLQEAHGVPDETVVEMRKRFEPHKERL